MNKTYLTIFLILFSFCAVAQKENNIWLGGTLSGLNFNSGTAVPFTRNDSIDISVTNASICDKQGNLLFYTNGYYVLNRNFQIMPNGNHLDIGDFGNSGYNELDLPDAAAIIPVPDDSNKYYLFYVDDNFVSYGNIIDALMPTHLKYSVVDMTLDGGLGDIVSGKEDVVVLSDTLTDGGFKIVKHANGRDYWLICHEHNSNRFYSFLIDPYGVHGPYSQYIGYVFYGDNEGIGSTLIFNPNANMAAQLSSDSTSVQLYNFDRCTGEFYNLINFKVSDTSYQVISGAFSPNGKCFYASANGFNYIWQFDLTAPDIFASGKLIAKYDNAVNPTETNFYALRLAPDNKIYVHPYSYEFSIHVINYPDSVGTGCGFVENAIHFNPPGYDWQGFPNIVNYSLGALPGACDSLTGVNQLQSTLSWKIHPNPTQDILTIELSNNLTPKQITITDALGRAVLQLDSDKSFNQVDVHTLVVGIYFIRLTDSNGFIYSAKFVKE